MGLLCPGEDAADAVCDGQPVVVVAVNAHHDFLRDGLRHLHIARHLFRRGGADGVRDVQPVSPRVPYAPDDSPEEAQVGPRRVFGRKLYLHAETLGVAHTLRRPFEHLFAGDVQLVLQVNVGAGEKDVDRVHPALDCRIDVQLLGPREAADFRRKTSLCDQANALLFSLRGYRETSLDDVDPEPIEPLRDLELLLGDERNSRGLLAVAERRVEDPYDSPLQVINPSGLLSFPSWQVRVCGSCRTGE